MVAVRARLSGADGVLVFGSGSGSGGGSLFGLVPVLVLRRLSIGRFGMCDQRRWCLD
jgi:hypothetical protein